MNLLSPNSDVTQPTPPARRSRRWLLVPLLLAAVLCLYLIVNLSERRYSEVGMYHPPSYRPLSEQGGKPAAMKPPGERPLPVKSEESTPPPARPVVSPPAAAAPPARPAAAASTTSQVKPKQAAPTPAPVIPPEVRVKAAAASVAKPAGGGKSVPEAAKAAREVVEGAANRGSFTLLIGEFAGGQETKKVRALLKKAGIAPVSEEKVKSPARMHRLLFGEFGSYQAAEAAFRKLQEPANGAFVTKEKEKYAVYAGSYLHEKKAVAEQQRLSGVGITVSMQTAQVTIPLTRLTAGSFPSNEAAEKEAARLEKHGCTARVIKSGS